jgi:hypothetical protein
MGTLEFRRVFPVFFYLRIYISKSVNPSTARIPSIIPTIPPVDRSFFEDELAGKNKVLPLARFIVSLGKYSSGLNSSVAFCE